MKTVIKVWILLVIVISGFSGLLYASIQSNLREGANDPQLQLAEDAAAKLSSGESVQSVLPPSTVNIATSLAPYIIVFDASGKPVASSALLNGQMPTIPAGVFDSVKQNGEDRITWQPQEGVRSAVVVVQVKGSNPGFVLAGRSLREVENREDDARNLILLGWASLLVVSCLLAFFFFRQPASSQA